MHAISTIFPNAQRRGHPFHLGQSWWRIIQPLVCQKTTDKNSATSKWLVLFFGLSLLPSDEVDTAFADEIMSTIPADDRCRKFADYTVDYYTDSGCDSAAKLRASSPQEQSPTTTNATETLYADYTRGELHQLGYIRRVGYRFAP